MKNKHKQFRTEITMIAAVSCIAGIVVADGYRNPPPTAEGIGKSGVNMAFVDDASAISYSPANLAMQTNKSFVISATFARTESTYTPIGGGDIKSDGDWNILPNIYYSQPIGDKGLVAGIGINTPNGQGASYDSANSTAIYEASLMFININPTLAAKVSDTVYIAVGLDLAYSQLNLKSMVAFGPPPFSALEASGEGWGFGGNAGITWIPAEQHRVALTYRGRMTIDYKGDAELDGADFGDFKTTIKYPDSLSLGYGIQLTDEIQLEAMLEWLQWSVNKTQPIEAGTITDQVSNNWNDTYTAGFSGSWAVSKDFVVRAGYAYIPSPIPDRTVTPLLIDEDRHALSIGLGYAFGSGHQFDLAYTHSIYNDREDTPSGSYEVDSNLLGMTYSMSF